MGCDFGHGTHGVGGRQASALSVDDGDVRGEDHWQLWPNARLNRAEAGQHRASQHATLDRPSEALPLMLELPREANRHV